MKKKHSSGKLTNAVRMVEAAGFNYEIMEYDAPDGFLDGVSVAEALGQNPDQTFKTLLTVGASGDNYVCVIPVARELDLKKAAKQFGEKKLERLLSKKITQVTGYIKGGCSPVGMKKLFATAIDSSALKFDSIMVSAGKVGMQMKVPLEALMEITGAGLADLTK